jgi:LysM repeat protein
MDAMATGPYDENRGSRTVARVFAVLALAIVSIVLVAVIASSVDDSSSGPGTGSTTASTPKEMPTDPYYVVQEGDTFSGIAAKEGVTPAHLKKVNAGRPIDPDLLRPTQCIDIVPDGCSKLAGG